MPATKNLDQLLDDLVDLDDPQQLDQLIGRTEAKLNLLRALRGLEAPNGHVPPPIPKALTPPRPAKKRKAQDDDDPLDEKFDGPPAPKESSGSRAENKLGRQRAIAHILKQGPRSLSDLSRETAIGTSTLWNLLKSPWFEQAEKGGPYSLTDEGRVAIKNKPNVHTLKREPKPPKAATAKPKAAAGELPAKLGAFLKANGPKSVADLRKALDCDGVVLTELVDNHSWFERDHGLVRLTSAGHTHFSAGQEP